MYWIEYGYTSSYAYNDAGVDGSQYMGLGLGGRRMSDGPADVSNFTWTKEAEVARPAEMLAVGDGPLCRLPAAPPSSGEKVYADPKMGDPLHVNPLSVSDWARYAQPDTQRLRHGGRYNTLFCDGYVEQVRFEDLYGRQSSWLCRWNRDNIGHRDLLP